MLAQADLKEEVYIEQPNGLSRKDRLDMVLKFIKGMYGLKQSPKNLRKIDGRASRA